MLIKKRVKGYPNEVVLVLADAEFSLFNEIRREDFIIWECILQRAIESYQRKKPDPQ